MTSDDMKNTAKDIADRVEQKSVDARSSMRGTASKTGDMARDFAAQASDTASDLYGRAQDNMRDVADRLPGTASDAVAASQRAYQTSSKTVAHHVSKQPLEALLLAGAIGYLVGWATNRS